MPMDHAVLKTEMDTTYAGLTNGSVLLAINDEAGPNAGPVDVRNLDPATVQSAVVIAEFDALTAGKQRAWLAIVGLESIPVQGDGIRDQVKAIWGSGTATRAELVALQTRTGSHAEVLFGQAASLDNIRDARELP